MKRRSGEVLVIGEERLDEAVLPFDDGDDRGGAEPRVGERPAANAVRGWVASRVRQLSVSRRHWQAALGGGALLALVGAWLAVGAGNLETPSSLAPDPVEGVSLVGERHQASRTRTRVRKPAGITRADRDSRGRAAREDGAGSSRDVEASAPSPIGAAPTTAPPTPPLVAAPTATADPAPAAPTPASPATVQREFGP